MNYLDKLLGPTREAGRGDTSDQLRTYFLVGSAIAVVPVVGVVIYEATRGFGTLFFLTAILLAALVINLFIARSRRLSLWPARITTTMVIFLIGFNLAANHSLSTLFWAVCLPPIFIFIYRRLEGLCWSTLLFLLSFAWLLAPEMFAASVPQSAMPEVAQLPGAIPPGAPISFTLSFLLSSTIALAFQSIYVSTNDAAVRQGEALAREEERFRDFAAIASDWLFEFDANYRFTYVSSNLLDQLADGTGGIVGRSIADLLPRQIDAASDSNSEFLEALRERAPLRDARFAFRVDERRYTINVNMKPIYAGDEFLGYRGVATDVSEIADREDQLREKDRVLYRAQKMEAVGQLTSGLAHDFNNLLTVIRGNLDLLELDTRDPGHKQELRAAQQATRRAGELTSKLLAFARRQPLQPRSTNAAQLVNSMAEMLQRTLGEGVSIAISSAQNLWPCMVDGGQLESALLNLAINARDAMPEGGRLNISLVNETVASDEELAPGDYVRIDVSDSGSGIQDSIKDLVFDPFFSTKSQGKGSGLGLSMVYGFARQSSGDVRIAKNDGSGTTMRLYLPRAAEAGAASSASTDAAPGEVRRGYRILVVEDDAGVRDLLATMLAAMGHSAEVLATAALAQTYFTEHDIDLLITDVVLADTESGVRLAEALRAQAPRLPILFVSGYAQPIANETFKLDEHMRLLGKPFGIDEIAAVIDELLTATNTAKGSTS